MISAALLASSLTFTAADLTDPNVMASMEEIVSIFGNSGIELSQPSPSNDQVQGIAIPPTAFNKPYLGDMTIIWETGTDLAADCGQALKPYRIVQECAGETRKGNCTMMLPISFPMQIISGRLAALFYHGRAHCEGWNAAHSNQQVAP